MPIFIHGQLYQAVIFDVDDTLIDTSQSYDVAIKNTVQHFTHIEVEACDLSLVRAKGLAYGVNNDWHVTWLLMQLVKQYPRTQWTTVLTHRELPPVNPTDPHFIEMQTFFQELYLGKPPFSGNGLIDTAEKKLYSADFFPTLQKLGVKIAVVTSRPTIEAEYTLGHINGLLGTFITQAEFMISFGSRHANGELIPEKPSPQPLWECARRLGVAPHHCIYVGNSRSDYLAAAQAHIDFAQVGSSCIERSAEPPTFHFYQLATVDDLLG